ncbi:MAG: STT3 domain-containing protein, partial [Atribacterota bacterium]
MDKKLRALALISCAIIVLFFNSYFTYTSGDAFNPDGDTLGTRFYLAGPDPYYNMRLCEETIETGIYPIGDDPLLNYPDGAKGPKNRPPIFNMIAVGCAQILSPFIGIIDALGWSMLILPAIYGALLVFPVYGIGKELFNEKIGLIAAFCIPIIPAHVGVGHGSGFSLFDHDSFVLLLTTVAFYFVVRSLKHPISMSLKYSIFAGIIISLIRVSWVTGYFIYVVLVVYLLVQLIIDIVREENNIENVKNISTVLGIGMIIPIAFSVIGYIDFPNVSFVCFLASVIIYGIYFVIIKYKIPWLVSLSSLFGLMIITVVVASMGLFHNVPGLKRLSRVISGGWLYNNEASLTVAELGTLNISNIFFVLGIGIFFMMICGFVLFLFKTEREQFPQENIFVLVVFGINVWLICTSVRFVNDFIPLTAILAAYMIFIFFSKVRFKDINTNILVLGFVLVLLVTPCLFFSYNFASGTDLRKEHYWTDACSWLVEQDTDMLPEERPAFLSWWDYGFYEVAVGRHPTIGDNFQNGLETTSNFLTAQSEKEAISVLILRLSYVAKDRDVTKFYMRNNTYDVFSKYLSSDDVDSLKYVLDNPKRASSYNDFFANNWGNVEFRVSAHNALYHDGCGILDNLSLEQIANLYEDIKNVTGFNIQYFGVEKYDNRIFPVITFLADKGVYDFFINGSIINEDDYFIFNETTWKRNEKQSFYDTIYYKMFYNNSTLEYFHQVYS